MTLVLGLGNKARHGKDTFAEAVEHYYLKQHAAAARHGVKFYRPVVVQRLAFADALYREVNAWLKTEDGIDWINFSHDTDYINGIVGGLALPQWVRAERHAEISSRAPYGKHAKLLQWWGTEYRRAQDSNYWVKQWKAGIDPKADIVIATDMRFFNEAMAVQNIGGYTIQVSRLNSDGTRFIDPSRDANHVSETELDDYNYDHRIIVKTGDVALLEELAVTYVHYLRMLTNVVTAKDFKGPR